MIKRILLALDQDEDTILATDYAIDIAERTNAAVTGLAIVDIDHIRSEAGGGGIGTIYYVDKLVRTMTATGRKKAYSLLDTFREKIEEAGLEHARHMDEGVPFERIIEDMKIHDLLVIGKDSHFFYNRPEKTTKTLDKVVKEGVSPVLIINRDSPGPHVPERVLIAYDGSSASARTMQSFAQLQPYGNDMKIDLVHVRGGESDEAREDSTLLLDLAASFLEAHKFEAIEKNSLEKGDPGVQILEYAEETLPELIVAGAHSVSAIRRLTFGSTTHSLVKNSDIPLFLSK